VDSVKLLKEINKQASKNQRKIDCLLQVHIAKEETKFGLDEDEVKELLEGGLSDFTNVMVKGLMGMASFVNDEKIVRKEFQSLKSLFDQFTIHHSPFTTLSLGMSGDYKIAIEEGSNMVRIGSLLFGKREAKK
jgi:pyridoxal phosphate enzyme (YggS family)